MKSPKNELRRYLALTEGKLNIEQLKKDECTCLDSNPRPPTYQGLIMLKKM